jgi:HD-like signal output (HDOD) protein
MASNKTPRNLADWQQQLQRLRLPIDPINKSAALQKLGSRTGNANNVAAIVERDPVLSLQLIHEANKTLSLSANESYSLSHSISLLGFPQVESLIRALPIYDPKAFPQLAEFRQQLAISRHAACQAEAWAEHNPHWQQPGLYWATLFQRAPIWALWYHAGGLMQRLDYHRATHRSAQQAQAEQQLLGCRIQPLAAALSRSWRLPTLTQLSWQSSQRGTARDWIMLSKIDPELALQALEQRPRLQQQRNNSGFLIALANTLADASEWDWYSRRSLRLQHILSTALQLPLSSTIALSHQLAVTASHSQPDAHSLSPARQLISFYRKADVLQLQPPAMTRPAAASKPAAATPPPTRPTATNKPATATQPPPSRPAIKQPPPAAVEKKPLIEPPPAVTTAPAAATDSSSYSAVIERLVQRPDSFDSVAQLLELALTTLCKQLKFERATASLFDKDRQQLHTRYSFGADDSPALKTLRHPLRSGDLFDKLLQKPLSMRLRASNYSTIWPLLPGSFKQASGGVDEFFMMSVFAKQQPIAIIYVDHGNSNRPLSDQQYQQFKQLCRALCHCLPAVA